MGFGLLTAGESSGDRIAAALYRELRAQDKLREWRGMAGPDLRRCAGFHPIGKVEDLSGAGVVELIPRLPKLLRGRRALQRELDAGPDIAIFVDAPDLHLPLARRARRNNVPVVQLVVPQFWAWRPKRKAQLAQDVQLSLCLFPFEVAPLRALGAAAHWVGHPLIDSITQTATEPEASETLRIALLPGSRPNEVKGNLERLRSRIDSALGRTPRTVIVPWRLSRPPPAMEGVEFTSASGQDVLTSADLAVVAFGTACLEAALLGVPQLSFGSAHPITRRLVENLIQTEWFALPNIVLKRQAVDEFILPEGASHFEGQLRKMTESLSSHRRRSVALAEELRAVLGPPGFATRAAHCLEPLL